jgi:murein L,D-transpeptidase YcbB/YkuD
MYQSGVQNVTISTTKKAYRQFYGSLVQQSRRSVTREEAVQLCNTRISATQSRKDRGLKKYTDVTKIKCTWGDEQIYPATSAVSTATSVTPQVLGISTSSLCLDAPRNMHRGHNEPREVLRLQSFLAEKGFLEEDNVTGFYGDKTIEAVKDYQASVGLPVTGMTYSLTREAMRMESCR